MVNKASEKQNDTDGDRQWSSERNQLKKLDGKLVNDSLLFLGYSLGAIITNTTARSSIHSSILSFPLCFVTVVMFTMNLIYFIDECLNEVPRWPSRSTIYINRI